MMSVVDSIDGLTSVEGSNNCMMSVDGSIGEMTSVAGLTTSYPGLSINNPGAGGECASF